MRDGAYHIESTVLSFSVRLTWITLNQWTGSRVWFGSYFSWLTVMSTLRPSSVSTNHEPKRSPCERTMATCLPWWSKKKVLGTWGLATTLLTSSDMLLDWNPLLTLWVFSGAVPIPTHSELNFQQTTYLTPGGCALSDLFTYFQANILFSEGVDQDKEPQPSTSGAQLERPSLDMDAPIRDDGFGGPLEANDLMGMLCLCWWIYRVYVALNW